MMCSGNFIWLYLWEGPQYLESKDTTFGLSCLCPTWQGYRTRVGHGCTHVPAVSFFFFEKWWALQDTVGTRIWAQKKSWKPKMHLSCRSPPLSSSSSCMISSLFFFLSCDLLPFLSPLMQSLLLLLLITQARSISLLQFSPFSIFPLFCLCCFLYFFCHTDTHVKHLSPPTHVNCFFSNLPFMS